MAGRSREDRHQTVSRPADNERPPWWTDSVTWVLAETKKARPCPRSVARTVVSNAKMRILLPGVCDLDTLRYFSDLLGQTRVSVGSSQTGPDGRRSRSSSEHREALAPLHLLQQLPDGEAVVLYQNLPPARVRLRRWFADKDLRRLASAEVAR